MSERITGQLGLRGQLAVQVAVGLLAVGAMLLLLRAYITQVELDRVGRARQSVGGVLAGYVDSQLTSHLSDLANLAGRFGLSGSTDPRPMLAEARVGTDESVYGLFVLNAGGAVIAAEPPGIATIAAISGQRSEVTQAMAAGRPVVSGAHIGPLGRPQFVVAVPIRLGGELGLLGCFVDPTSPRFVELVGAAGALDGRTIAEVVDQFGTVVAASQRERALLPTSFPATLAHLGEQRRTGIDRALSANDLAGGTHLVAYAPLSRASWGLILAVPEEDILNPIRQIDGPLIALGVATTIVLIGLALLTARSVVVPVRQLIGSAGGIARGDLTSPVPPSGRSELGALSRALDDMRRGLHAAEQARAEIDQLKDEFISSVSHELRTPLGYIKGYATTLLRRDTRWNPRTARRCLEIIDQSSDQLLELVDHLLDMSRINEGRMSVNPEPTAIGALVQEAAQRAAIRSSAHRIEVTLAPDLPEAMADAARLHQVIDNLIDNGIKYSPEGGTIEIDVRTAAEETRAMICLSVRDPGIGIPHDQLEAVFDRFNRGRNPMVRKVRGVGLGLPICRGIIEAHRGRIWAVRAPDRGTIVRFTLPVAEPAAIAA